MPKPSEGPLNVAGEKESSSQFTKKFQQRAVILLMVVYTLNYLDRSILNILAESVKRDLQLQDWQLGLLTGLAFSLFYSTLGIPIARYAERADRPKLIALAMTIWCGATALTGAVQSFTHMILARVIVGVGEAGCTPPAHSLISDYVPKKKRASALAVYSLGIPMGMLLGLALGGFLADYLGWRLAFVVVGLPGLLIAGVVLWYLKEPRRSETNRNVSAPEIEPVFSALLKIFKIPTFRWGVFASSFLVLAAMGIATFYGSFFLRNHGAELEEMAAMFGLRPMGFLGLSLGLTTGLSGLVGTFLGGYLADKWRERGEKRAVLLVPAISTLVCIPLFLTVFLVPSIVVSLLFVAIASTFFSMWYGPFFAAAHTVVVKSSRATASALALMLNNLIGLTLGPLLVGFLSDFFNSQFDLGGGEGLRWALVFITLFMLIGSVMFYQAGSHLERDSLE